MYHAHVQVGLPVTRMGDDSKLCLIGDPLTQNDRSGANWDRSVEASGLEQVAKEASNQER